MNMKIPHRHIHGLLASSIPRMALFLILFCQGIGLAYAHHVLGRPAYSLNEDSNTPPSMNLETRVGDYFVTAMVYPAFPRPGESGRINLYATHVDSGKPLNTGVSFKVREDSWFSQHQETLGAQVLDDTVRPLSSSMKVTTSLRPSFKPLVNAIRLIFRYGLASRQASGH